MYRLEHVRLAPVRNWHTRAGVVLALAASGTADRGPAVPAGRCGGRPGRGSGVFGAGACWYPAGLVDRVAADRAGLGELVAVGGQMAVDQCQQPLDLAGVRPHGGVDHLRQEAQQDLVGAVGQSEAVVAEDPVVVPVLGVVVAVLDDVALGRGEPWVMTL